MLVEVAGQLAHLLLRVLAQGIGDFHLVTVDLDAHGFAPLLPANKKRFAASCFAPGVPRPPR
jgi:hypothetical protein